VIPTSPRPASETNPLRVLVAGGGVAGLEALLALRALAGARVSVELLTPGDQFVYRPLLVAEPFGSGGITTVDLPRVVDDAGARFRRDALAAIEPGAHAVTTAAGDRLEYGALLVALGARPVDAVPGALTFSGAAERARFRELLQALGRRGTKRVAFVVPAEATWSIAAYELALLTASERDVRAIRGTELVLVTPEKSPLDLFGVAAAQLVSTRLEEARIQLRLSAVAERFEDRTLHLAGGDSLDADRVVALPGLEVPVIPGLPQQRRGFVRTDVGMHVAGLEDVWVAGDATSFPIKQGGLAAQQADVAARSIAARAGAHVPIQPFQPLLRAALITGGSPEFVRVPLHDPGSGVVAEGRALWSPSTKLAAHYLGPYLAAALAGESSRGELVDLELSSDPEAGTAEHERGIELLLAAADADARHGDFERALKWLSLVEELDVVIPASYVGRRDEWRTKLDPGHKPDPAAQRVDLRFDSAAAALSDLQRRIGWLREIETRTETDMAAGLSELEAGIENVAALARKAGVLPASGQDSVRT
jgi:sulfide:quinone oxidoreductase